MSPAGETVRALRTIPLEGALVDRAGEMATARAVAPHHHPCWLEVLRRAGEDARGVAAVEGERLLGWLLYSVRRAAASTVVSSLPYLAYGGPAVPEWSSDVAVTLVQSLRDEAVRLGAEAIAVGWSPLCRPDEVEAVRSALGATHEARFVSQIQGLERHPLEALTPKRRDAIRSEARRAPRAGMRLEREIDEPRFEEWIAMYHSRMSQLGTAAFPASFLRAIREIAVPAGAAEIWWVAAGERVVGAVIFLVSRGGAEYYLSAFREDTRASYPSTFLLLHAFDELHARGVSWFNWQGSGGNAGVVRFKARWGAVDAPYGYVCSLLRSDGPLLEASPEEARRAFPFGFVLPSDAWRPRPAAGVRTG